MNFLTRLHSHFAKPHAEPGAPKTATKGARHKGSNAADVKPLQKHTIATASADGARVVQKNAPPFEEMQRALDCALLHLSQGEQEDGKRELQAAVVALTPVTERVSRQAHLAQKLLGAHLREALPKLPEAKLLGLEKNLRESELPIGDLQSVIQFAVKAERLRLALAVPVKPRPDELEKQGMAPVPSDWSLLSQEKLVEVEKLAVELREAARRHPWSLGELSGTQFTQRELQDLATRARHAVFDSDVAAVSKEADPNKKLAVLLKTVRLFAEADIALLDARKMDQCIVEMCTKDLSKTKMSALQEAEKFLTQCMSSSTEPKFLLLLLAVKAQLLHRNIAAMKEKRGVALEGITEAGVLKLKRSTLPKLQKRAAELVGFAQGNRSLKAWLSNMGYKLTDLEKIERLASAATKVRVKASRDAVEQEGQGKSVKGPADDEVNMDELLDIQARISDMPQLPSVPGDMQTVFETLQNEVANRSSVGGGGEPTGERLALQDVEDLLSQSQRSRVAQAQAQAMLQDASPEQMADADLDALEDAVILLGLSDVPAPNLGVAGRLVKARIELRDALEAAKAETDNNKKLEQLLMVLEAARVVVDVAGKESREVEELRHAIDEFSAAGLHTAEATVLVAAEKRLTLMASAYPNVLSIGFLTVAVKTQLIGRAVRSMPRRYGVQLHEITKDNVPTLQKSMLVQLKRRTVELMQVIEIYGSPTDQAIQGVIATLQTIKKQAEDAIKLFQEASAEVAEVAVPRQAIDDTGELAGLFGQEPVFYDQLLRNLDKFNPKSS
ncbi:hypothetical protein [Hydrogenophaga sp. BPS33]|uniref:hypothetical protein n=1 Tax=Hydrogenophaga sp. BPS33 TaxID=2651974 RepID=UPI00131FD18C|nr:hypothetical protein [Hydrogenophaga sp. BPS33]QHE85182.1 hypothetical protein F9K07_09925 [Hydrogenophaga sp. BPS33]